jgi:hypothetical protein
MEHFASPCIRGFVLMAVSRYLPSHSSDPQHAKTHSRQASLQQSIVVRTSFYQNLGLADATVDTVEPAKSSSPVVKAPIDSSFNLATALDAGLFDVFRVLLATRGGKPQVDAASYLSTALDHSAHVFAMFSAALDPASLALHALVWTSLVANIESPLLSEPSGAQEFDLSRTLSAFADILGALVMQRKLSTILVD